MRAKFDHIKCSEYRKTETLDNNDLTYSSKIMIDKKNMLGVGISDATKEEVLEYVVKNLENFHKKLFFVTPNPEFLVLASKNEHFKNILIPMKMRDGILIKPKMNTGNQLKDIGD